MKCHLVLDLDGTLVHDGNPRPGLSQFLEFCFDNFKTVSIWTAADRSWWNFCWTEHMLQFDFDRVLSRKDCEFSLTSQKIIKPLRKIWANYPDCTKFNTLLIDDTPIVAEENPRNLISIPMFGFDKDDKELELMQKVLSERIAQFKQTQDIRSSKSRP